MSTIGRGDPAATACVVAVRNPITAPVVVVEPIVDAPSMDETLHGGPQNRDALRGDAAEDPHPLAGDDDDGGDDDLEAPAAQTACPVADPVCVIGEDPCLSEGQPTDPSVPHVSARYVGPVPGAPRAYCVALNPESLRTTRRQRLALAAWLAVSAAVVCAFAGAYCVLNKPRVTVKGLNLYIGGATNSLGVETGVSRPADLDVHVRNRNLYPATWRSFDVDVLFEDDGASAAFKLASFGPGGSVDVPGYGGHAVRVDGDVTVDPYVADRYRRACRRDGRARLKLRGTARGKPENGAGSPRERHILSRWRDVECSY